MSTQVGVQAIEFTYGGARKLPPFQPVLVGVVGSGNLEVLLETSSNGNCTFVVETSARGFESVWGAVLSDFHSRHGLSGVRISIHDMGATPAVVTLRLEQAMAELFQGVGQ
jgi:malonate decarboxylase delta subunit